MPPDAARFALRRRAPHVFAEQLTIDGVRAISTRFAEDAEFSEKFGRYHADARAVVDRWSAAWLAPAFRSWTIEPTLAAIGCPILLMQSEHDPYGSLERLERIARAVRGPVHRAIVAGSGHAPHRDCRARALPEMTVFLASMAIT